MADIMLCMTNVSICCTDQI